MVRRESLESCDGRVEIEIAREIKRGVQQRTGGWHNTLGDRDSMKCRAGVNPDTHGEINGISPLESPFREGESLLQRLASFARSADEKDPERFDPVLLDPLGDFAHLGRVETLLELFENRIAGALGCYAERAEAGDLHRAQQLR